jgi:hypothetical protein
MSTEKRGAKEAPKYEQAVRTLVSKYQASKIPNLSYFAMQLNDALGIDQKYARGQGFRAEQGMLIFRQNEGAPAHLLQVSPIIKNIKVPVAIESCFYREGGPSQQRFVAFLVPTKIAKEIERVPLRQTGGAIEDADPHKRGRKKDYESETISAGGLGNLLSQYGFLYCLKQDTAVDVTVNGENVYTLVSPEIFSDNFATKQQGYFSKPKAPDRLSVKTPKEVEAGHKQISEKEIIRAVRFDPNTEDDFGSLGNAFEDVDLKRDDFVDPLAQAFSRVAASAVSRLSNTEEMEGLNVTSDPEVIAKWKQSGDYQEGDPVKVIRDIENMSRNFQDAATDANECKVATIFKVKSGPMQHVEVMIAPSIEPS